MKEHTALNASPTLKLPTVELHSFLQSIAQALPQLIKFIGSDMVRNHPLWGRVIPFDVTSYGSYPSPGHCVRPDMIITDEGRKVTEFDIVPLGRGDLIALLDAEQADEVLDGFMAWYHAMGVQRVRYATTSNTSFHPDCDYFAQRMRRKGFDIEAVDIDTLLRKETPNDITLIDRLFYRSDMQTREAERSMPGRLVMTAEPWLDSKAIFALVHDQSMTAHLEAALGSENLAFLRNAMPESWLLHSLESKGLLDKILDHHQDFVIKGTDVETAYCWGGHSVIAGNQCTAEEFARATKGKGSKPLGRWPIVQRFHKSINFRHIWNGIIDGLYPDAYPDRSPTTKMGISEHVTAKFGTFFLVANSPCGITCTYSRYGIVGFRTNVIVDASDDAKWTNFEAV